MTLYPIPASFIYNIASLSWCDIKWGYEYKFISGDIPIKKAEENVLTNTYTTAELELSFLTHDGSDVTSFLEELCPACKQEDESTIKKKWLFIILSWLWNQRENLNEPLLEVENIYADFSYPSEIENFVRYMPVTDGYDPSIHSEEENTNRLMDNWRKYLDENFFTI